MSILLLFLIMINSLTIIAFVFDKMSSMRGGRRVPEITLHALAMLGGVYVMMILMNLIRHKNNKFSFYIVTIIIAIIWLAIVYYGLDFYMQLEK